MKISRRQLTINSIGLITGLSLSKCNSITNDNTEKYERHFLDDNFLLYNKPAEYLYHEYAEKLPIIDFHNHLPPDEIASNKQFDNITQIWLTGDHYKMRAMRANGVNESFITGDSPDYEKFLKWAETVPFTLKNPLYHWTHLELKRYFGIEKLLSPVTAKKIYEETSALLRTEKFRVKNLLSDKNIEVICTTDDPADDLIFHTKILSQNYPFHVLPAWRPDKVMAVENSVNFNVYIERLSKAADINISRFQDLLIALNKRQEFFRTMGCKLSDHGLSTFFTEKYTEGEINTIFNKIRSGKELDNLEISKYKSAILIHLAEMNHYFGWVQQFHLGALRNNNTRMFNLVGPDKGFDSIGDFPVAQSMSSFFDSLDSKGKLTKTIVYNLNTADTEIIITMLGNFYDGILPGKMQYGSAWWFHDQKDGIERQINSLSNYGMLGRFVGMLTDSRSFLSFPRHEYFRRILCNLIGTDVENGELPNDMEWLGKIVQGICYKNAKEYFNFS